MTAVTMVEAEAFSYGLGLDWVERATVVESSASLRRQARSISSVKSFHGTRKKIPTETILVPRISLTERLTRT